MFTHMTCECNDLWVRKSGCIRDENLRCTAGRYLFLKRMLVNVVFLPLEYHGVGPEKGLRDCTVSHHDNRSKHASSFLILSSRERSRWVEWSSSPVIKNIYNKAAIFVSFHIQVELNFNTSFVWTRFAFPVHYKHML